MKHILFWVFCLFAFLQIQAQNPEFSQFFANPLYTNPAFAGTASNGDNAAGRATANYRNQWPGGTGSQTFSFGLDQNMDQLHGGVGIQYLLDNNSPQQYSHKSILAMYNTKLDLGHGVELRIGFLGGYVSRYFAYNRMGFGNPSIFPTGQGRNIANYPTFGSGFLIQNKHFYISAAVSNLNLPRSPFSKNRNVYQIIRYTAQAGYYIELPGTKFAIAPQVLIMEDGSLQQIVPGVYLYAGKVFAGGSMRNNFGAYKNSDQAIGCIGYNGPTWRIIYSYEKTVSDGRSTVPYSHEVSLCFRWNTKQNAGVYNPLTR